MSSFHLATASLPGREHVRLLRNNQDGVGARVEGEVAVMVVTDGCGSGGSSEVGARLGAKFLAQKVPGWGRELGLGLRLAEHAADALAQWVAQVVGVIAAEGPARSSLIAEQWLFTFLCAVMDSRQALIFGVGDGVWSADGAGQVLDPGADNAPDYLAYRLVPDLLPAQLQPPGGLRVHFLGEARQLAVATDGLSAAPSALEALGSDPVVWRNPVALQRKLRVLSERERALYDDTTVALMKRSG